MKHGYEMLEIDGEHPDKFLHHDTTERIIGGAFEVHGELGHPCLIHVRPWLKSIFASRSGLFFCVDPSMAGRLWSVRPRLRNVA
jgi:hypothetical protein